MHALQVDVCLIHVACVSKVDVHLLHIPVCLVHFNV